MHTLLKHSIQARQHGPSASLCGMVLFTYTALLTLHIVGPVEPIQQTTEREQVGRAEGGATAANAPELVVWLEVGQMSRQ